MAGAVALHVGGDQPVQVHEPDAQDADRHRRQQARVALRGVGVAAGEHHVDRLRRRGELLEPRRPRREAWVLLPAVILGFALHDFIKQILFESPAVVCWSLLIGGIVLGHALTELLNDPTE